MTDDGSRAAAGKSVRLFLADGTPGGLLTAEIMNWTGHIVAAPRSDLAALLRRPEVGRTGVYLLLGDDSDSPGDVLAYIGEGDDVGKRLYLHARPEDKNGKDFWDRAVVLTSKDANLTKAHARYLESRLIAIASQAARARVANFTAPPPISLPEADVSDMEYFISQAKIVLPVLGVNIFRSTAMAHSSAAADGDKGGQVSPLFELRLAKEGLHAKAREVDGEFTVLAGSQARDQWVGAAGGYQQLREKLAAAGTLARAGNDDDAPVTFTRDQVFASPSAAAAILLGRSANGRSVWKAAGSRLAYGDWQARLIDSAGTPAEDD